MDGFTIIDGVVAGVIILSALLAYSRGFVREGMAILGWVLAASACLYLCAAGRASGQRDPGSWENIWPTAVNSP